MEDFLVIFKEKHSESLPDYKVFCFHSNPEMILVCSDRFGRNGLKEDFYNTNWEHLDIQRIKHGNTASVQDKPMHLGLMLELASKISDIAPFLRVDFYEVYGKVYFGEMTFFPSSGFEGFIPEKADKELGEYLRLE